MTKRKGSEQKEEQLESKTKNCHPRGKKQKEYFKNLLGNSAEVTDKPITKLINYQLDIILGEFTEALKIVVTKIFKKKEKLQASRKYHQKYGKQGNLMTYFYDFALLYINKSQ